MTLWPTGAGMAELTAVLSATDALACQGALTARAEQLRALGDSRPVGQRRVTALVQSLCGTGPHVQVTLDVPVRVGDPVPADQQPPAATAVWAAPASGPAAGPAGGPAAAPVGRPVWVPAPPIRIRLSIASALGLSEHPAHLAGYGPIATSLVRRLLPAADLSRALVDEHTGQPLHQETVTQTARSLLAHRASQSRHQPADRQPGDPGSRPPDPVGQQVGERGTSLEADSPIGPVGEPDGPRAPGRSVRERAIKRRSLRPAADAAAQSPPDQCTSHHNPPRRPAELRRVLLDLARAPALTPDPTTLSSPGYRIPAALRRHVQARDRTCTFPGCHVPAARCDLDHRDVWPSGPTDPENLDCLCRHHHRLKQQGWQRHRPEADGSIRWTSPRGHTYRRPAPWQPAPDLAGQPADQ